MKISNMKKTNLRYLTLVEFCQEHTISLPDNIPGSCDTFDRQVIDIIILNSSVICHYRYRIVRMLLLVIMTS